VNTEEKKAVLEAMGYEFCKNQDYWYCNPPNYKGGYYWSSYALEVCVDSAWRVAIEEGLVSADR
jgi:hypothetical protein